VVYWHGWDGPDKKVQEGRCRAGERGVEGLILLRYPVEKVCNAGYARLC
jgi:hypothetical protein